MRRKQRDTLSSKDIRNLQFGSAANHDPSAKSGSAGSGSGGAGSGDGGSRRKAIIQEILSTEEFYVMSLETVVTV